MGVLAPVDAPRHPLWSRRRLAGVDGLRLFAAALVTAQHALTLTGHAPWTTLYGVNLGDLGVAIFLAISGLLSATSQRSPGDWLWRRLVRLAPSYWLVMSVCFVATWVTRYNPFTAWQVVAQMLGVGLFTHPENLVNVPTWFLSLLLVCYAGLFAIQQSGAVIGGHLAAITAALAWGTMRDDAVALQALGFFAAAGLASGGSVTSVGRRLLLAGAGLAVWAPWSEACLATGIALALTGGAVRIASVPPIVTRLSRGTYEYFLVHGVALVLTTTLLPNRPLVAVATGVLLAAVAASGLHRWAEGIAAGRLAHH